MILHKRLYFDMVSAKIIGVRYTHLTGLSLISESAKSDGTTRPPMSAPTVIVKTLPM
jgi:hypothetical protein